MLRSFARVIAWGLGQARLADELFHDGRFRRRLREDPEAALAVFKELPHEERPVVPQRSPAPWWSDWSEVVAGLPPRSLGHRPRR